jgi:hypothetical protein
LILVSFLRFTVVAQTTNTGTVGESVAAESFDNGIIVFYTWEGGIDVDLNGDGDMLDDVIRYYNVSSGGTTNTTAVGYEPAIGGNIIAFLTDEFSVDEDLNNDTDKDDTVVRYYDVLSGITKNTGEMGYDVAVDNGIITFTVSEGWLSEDLNGDGDTDDRFIWYYDVSTELTFNATTILGAYASKDGDIIAFETWEEWDGIDLNGDGDTADPVIRYYNMSTETITNTTAVGHEVSVDGNIIAFCTFESDVGEDLNGDGDASDRVIRYYDISSGILTNTADDGEFPSVEGNIIAFETYEADFGEDLNGDGDTEDVVIRYYDISTGATINTAAVGDYASVDADMIAFYTYESSVDEDLNGDGDKTDSVIRYYHIPSIHQGDLILDDNDVYTIEGKFDINGSIIVTENATLILKNAIVNFTQTRQGQFNMTLQNPLDGHPRLIVGNASITTNGYLMKMNLFGNSTAEANHLTTPQYLEISLFSSSCVNISNAICGYVSAQQLASIHASNSSFTGFGAWDYTSTALTNCTLENLNAAGSGTFAITNCTINTDVQIGAFNLEYSVNGLEPGFFTYWNFLLNSSATGVSIPDLTLEDTYVNGWSFYLRWHTNATFSNSNLYTLNFKEFSQGTFYNVTANELFAYDNSMIHSFDSKGNKVYSLGNSRIWAVNSTTTLSYIYGQSEIYVYWYLDVHVTDSLDADVPYANVTATYSNTTVAESKLTDLNGLARLTLMQLKVNATDYYPVGNYTISGEYNGYSQEESIEMFYNQQITLTLPFVVPEFSSVLIMLILTATTLLTVIIRRKKLTTRFCSESKASSASYKN